MNPLLRHLAALLFLLSLGGPVSSATPEPANTPKAKLTFADWEKFTDISIGGGSDRASSDIIHSELSRHLASLAKRNLAPGQTLIVAMRDIDLAGVIEPWRGPDYGRVRYIRDTHPPRLVFNYQLLDADGKVLQEGSEKLTNLTFRYQFTPPSSEQAYFEKQLLTDWMRERFGTAKPPKKPRQP